MENTPLVIDNKKNTNSKIAAVAKWTAEHATLPKQGSQAWLDGRKFRIGGSQCATIEGSSPWGNKKDLIAQHLGLTQFMGNAACMWGKITEEVTTIAFEILFDCSVYVPGSIPHPTVTCHANSPDGVTYIKAWDKIVLIEIKNPSGRIPGSTIPKYYKSQIKSGLSTIPICDFALFVDHMQRKCAHDDLRPTSRKYDTRYHNEVRDRVRNDPILITMLGVYCYEEPYQPSAQLIDFGKSDKAEFENMLKAIVVHNTWSVHYGQVYICDGAFPAPAPSDWITEFDTYCQKNNYHMIGVLPLKTFRLSIIPMHREPDYIENLQDEMYRIVNIIKELDGLDPMIQKSKLSQYFDTPHDRKVNTDILKRKLAKCGLPG